VRTDSVNEGIKGLAAILGPNKGDVGFKEVCKGLCDGRKIWDKWVLIAQHSKDWLEVFQVSRGSWPIFDGQYFGGVDGDAGGSELEAKKVNFCLFEQALWWFQEKEVVLENVEEGNGDFVMEGVLPFFCSNETVVHVVLETGAKMGIQGGEDVVHESLHCRWAVTWSHRHDN